MSIPKDWRGLFEPGTEKVPFWTVLAADLRGRYSGRAAGLAREHQPGRADYLHVSVECPVAASFRMMPQRGGLVPSMPLSSMNKDLPVGDEELDAAYSFWSDDPDRLALFVHQTGVRQALLQAASVADGVFCFLTIRGGQVKAVFDLSRTTCGPDRLRVILAALATLAAAAEGTWPMDQRAWAFRRFWDGGGAWFVLLALIVALGAFWYLVS